MVVKPSEQTSLQDFIVAQCCDQVGIPAGVFNLVPGFGQEVGAAMSGHSDIDLISFTGSTRAGIHIAKSAAHNVKRVIQELGGKSPLIITEDSNFEQAVEYGIGDVIVNTGQTCTALTRWFIPKSKRTEIMTLIKSHLAKIEIGADDNCDMGPLVTHAQQQRVLEYIQLGLNEGAEIIAGGLDIPTGITKGYYVKPTVFCNVKNPMRIAQEEIFGPVICLIEYSDLEDAIEMANDSPYGLSSAVFSKNKSEGLMIAEQLDSGMCYVNGGEYNIEAPFGGVKQSGNGREFGDHGLTEYIELQAIHL